MTPDKITVHSENWYNEARANVYKYLKKEFIELEKRIKKDLNLAFAEHLKTSTWFQTLKLKHNKRKELQSLKKEALEQLFKREQLPEVSAETLW